MKSIIGSLKNERFEINVSTDGSYSLIIDNVTWLDSDYTFLSANSFFYNTNDTTLHLDLTSAYSGNDVLGGSQSIQFDYSLFDDTLTTMNCTITTYTDYNLIKFTQVKDKILFLL